MMNDLYHHGLIGGPPALDWVRPADWTALPALVATDEKFVGIVAVWDDLVNHVAFTFTTNDNLDHYLVNWGDGSAVQEVLSGVAANHTYTYANVPGVVCSRGYKTALVTVTPRIGDVFSAIDLTTRHPAGVFFVGQGACEPIGAPWLDINFAGSFGTVYIASDDVNTKSAHYIERMQITHCHLTSIATNLLAGSAKLQSVPLLALSSVLTVGGLLYMATGIKSIDPVNLSAATSITYAFSNASSLRVAPDINLGSALTVFSGVFMGCNSMEKSKLYNLSNVIDVSMLHYGNFSLVEVPAYDLFRCTNLSSFVETCLNLRSFLPHGMCASFSLSYTSLSRIAVLSVFQRLGTVFLLSAGTNLTGDTWTVTLNATVFSYSCVGDAEEVQTILDALVALINANPDFRARTTAGTVYAAATNPDGTPLLSIAFGQPDPIETKSVWGLDYAQTIFVTGTPCDRYWVANGIGTDAAVALAKNWAVSWTG
jgi:hypothetical protein